MKKFDTAQAIGQAGEHLVGFIVTHDLGWPYRPQPIADLGVDGEIELFDDDRRSTHRVLKVQVKSDSTSTTLPSTSYVSKRDYQYWRLLSLPVIVCRPVLKTRRVYWASLARARDAGESFAFEFTDADELNATSRGALQALAVPRDATFDLFRDAVEKAFAIAKPIVSEHPACYAWRLDEFFAAYEPAMGSIEVALRLGTLFPHLVSARAATELERLRELHSDLRRRQSTLLRNVDD